MGANGRSLVSWVFVGVTGAIADHGITYGAPEGKLDRVRAPFGCIAHRFCQCVQFVDILGLS